MLSESILDGLELMQKADDKIDYEDDQLYEDVDGYESLRKILK